MPGRYEPEPTPLGDRGTDAGPLAGLGDLEISLAYLRDLLLQWREVWASVIEEMDQLPAAEQQRLQRFPTDPQEGLLAMSGVFATAIHPDVAHSLVSNLDAAARTVEQLCVEQERRCDSDAPTAEQVEQRLERLEAILGGVGAVLRTLDLRARDDGT